MSQGPAKVSPNGDSQKKKPEDLEKLEKGPVENRGCTDILCCLIFIGAVGFFAYLFIMAVQNGKPTYLLAVYDNSSKACGLDLPTFPYLYFNVPHPDYLLYENTCVDSCPVKNSTTALRAPLCNINPSVTNCSENCNPLAIGTGWSTTGTIDYASLFCLYNTSTFMSRICFPGDDLIGSVGGISSSLSTTLNISMLQSWFDDLFKAWHVIAASVGIVFVLGILYMLFTRIFAGVIIWICIILYFAVIIALGYFVFDKGTQTQTCVDKKTVDSNTGKTCLQSDVDTYKITSYVIWAIAGVSLIGLLCMWKNIKLAIAIIKTATLYVIDTPLSMLVPPFFAIAIAVWWGVWIFGFVHIYSWGTFKKSPTTIFGSVTHDEKTFIYIWVYIFIGLWVSAFILAVNTFVLASSTCIWYFSQGPGQSVHRPISRSLYRAFRYHLGSLAFGSFILAVVQLIRLILEYINSQAQKTGADKNKVTKCIIDCLRCCMACFERFIQFLNKNAYIQIALSGRNFCSAAKEAMTIIWNNAARYAIVGGMGGAFILIGKLFIILATVILCYQALIQLAPYKTTVSSPFLPCILIFVIAYAISHVFMMVYGMAIDAILVCFLYDEEQQKGKANAAPKHCPDLLRQFFEAEQKK